MKTNELLYLSKQKRYNCILLIHHHLLIELNVN